MAIKICSIKWFKTTREGDYSMRGKLVICLSCGEVKTKMSMWWYYKINAIPARTSRLLPRKKKNYNELYKTNS